MDINAIRSEIDALRVEARAVATKADAGDAAAVTRFAAIEARVAELRAQESRLAFLDDMDRRASGTPIVGGTGDAALDRLAGQVGLLDAIRAGMGGPLDAGAGRAVELSTELARRSGRAPQGIYWRDVPAPEQRTVVSTGNGAPIVPTVSRPDLFIDRLRNATRVRALGATVLTGLSGNVVIPARTASIPTGWAAEDNPVPTGDPTFAGVPLTMRTAGGIAEWSRNMVLQSSPDVEALARADLAATLAEVLDAAAIAGTGAPSPTGIVNTAGVTKIAAGGNNGGALSYDTLADLIGAVADANGEGSATGFLTNTKVRRALSKLKDASGKPLGLDVLFQGQKAAYSNLVPATGTKGSGQNLSTIVYGNFSELLIAVWSELDILVNPYAQPSYSKGNVMIRAMMSVDIAVRHAASFSYASDVVA